jgi:ribonuclease VapC
MVVDSSVLVAIIFEEPGFTAFVDRMSQSTENRLSAASLLEASIVINREMGAAGIEILKSVISGAHIQVVEFTEHQAHLAFAAHQRFGKGMGHPAQLNILDCCTYALAADLKEPLLFKGADFDKTDLALAK